MLQPDFLAGSAGRLFISCFLPPRGTDRWLLFLPPFAEEMNKSRRMMARLGYAMAEAGVGVCLPDLYGTGDSEGDFLDANGNVWEQDLLIITDWLRHKHGCDRLVLGGLRYGALLAMQGGKMISGVEAYLLWQPLHSGQQQLTQFLRLRQAGAIMGNGPKEGLKELQARLMEGESLEVAGYEISPDLARHLASLDMSAVSPPSNTPIGWLELSTRHDPVLSPVSQRLTESWKQRGLELDLRAIPGSSFWGSQELVDAPALVDVSTEILNAWLAA